MKGPKKKKNNREKEKKESAYPCVRICPRVGLRKTLILLDFHF